MELHLIVHRECYSITKMAPGSCVKDVGSGRFWSLSRLNGEITVACEIDCAPAGGETKSGFRLVEIRGDFALDSIGVVAAVAGPLAAAGVSLFAFSVWSTDAFLVQEADLERAIRALAEAGHKVVGA